jgi:glucose/arabinose dehydrogenase
MTSRRLLLLGLVAALAGCGGGDGDAPTVNVRSSPTPDATPALAAMATAAPSATGAQAEPPVRARGASPEVEVLARDLDVPWDLAFLPDGRALATERPGRVRLLSASGRLSPRPVATVPTEARGEGGLLGIAVDPDFAEGRRFVYLYATTSQGMQVHRWRMSGDRLRRDGVVLGGIAAGAIHDSGRLRFGPDDRLYVATGDSGTGPLAQQRTSLNGKILRLTQAQFRGRTSRPELYAIGVRNPQGLAWSPGARRLTITDHGPSGFDGPGGDDEVNVVRRGGNYGWPVVRGRDHGSFDAPSQVYPSAIAPSGATFVTRGGSSWTGDFVFAALKGRALHRLRFDGRRVVRDETLLPRRYGRLRAVVEAPDGALWVTTSNRDTYGSPVSDDDDRILRVLPPAR